MPKTKAAFIEPMLLLRTENLPQGADWSYEIKLDGYRALAIKTGGKVQLRSRNDNDFTERYSSLPLHYPLCRTKRFWTVKWPRSMRGRPSFNLLQNYGSSKAPLVFFVFDLLILKGRNVMTEPLCQRRTLRRARSCQSSLSRSATPRRWKPVFPISLLRLKQQGWRVWSRNGRTPV